MSTKQFDFTVVIPALNLRASLEFVLRALEAQSYPHDRFECVVVDDGSTDGTGDFLMQYEPSFSFRCLINKVPQGRSAARNSGWKAGRGSVIAFLDGDTLPSPDWLSDYARACEVHQHDVISGSRYCIDVDPKESGFPQQLAALAGTFPERLLKEKVREQFCCLDKIAAAGPYRIKSFELFELQLYEACLASPASLLSAYSFVGANVAVYKSWLEKINGFDQSLRRGEDTDAGIRLWEIGARFGFTDGAAAYHMATSTEVNRHLDPIEVTGFFYRHPYRLVLLIYLWFVRHFSGQAGHPALDNLADLIRQSSDESDLDIEAEFRRFRQPPIPAECVFTKEELVQFYEDFDHLPPGSISSFLDCAVAQGVYTKKQGSTRYFDFFLISNWLRACAPVHEFRLNGSCFRQYKHMFFPQRKVPAPYTLTCQCSYEIQVDAKRLNGHPITALTNIPLPVDSAIQKIIQFHHCQPPDLLSHRDDSRQMITHYPWPKDRKDIHIRYEFDCVIRENNGGLNGASDHSPIENNYSRLALPPKDYPKAKMILKKLGLGRHLEELEITRRIYYWILENISVNEWPSGASILDSGFGMCVDEAWLFINLCRLAGIPARHRCGALFGGKRPHINQDIFVQKTVCFSPFMHTWAEAYIAHHGWLPVDFCTWSYGRRILTHRNLYDPQLRREIVEETPLYDDYYFGNIDPYRIHVGEHANSALVSFERADEPGSPSWKMRTCLQHSLTCNILQIQ